MENLHYLLIGTCTYVHRLTKPNGPECECVANGAFSARAKSDKDVSWSFESEVDVSVRDMDVSCCSRSEVDASDSLKIGRQVANSRCSNGDEVQIPA